MLFQAQGKPALSVAVKAKVVPGPASRNNR
jgi:hypothetical protein